MILFMCGEDILINLKRQKHDLSVQENQINKDLLTSTRDTLANTNKEVFLQKYLLNCNVSKVFSRLRGTHETHAEEGKNAFCRQKV